MNAADLEALRRTDPEPAARARRPLLPRVTLVVVALGALGAALAILGPVLSPPREVRVGTVRSEFGGEGRRRAVTEKAGWLEADPYAVTVRPLVKGVVERLEVLEGATVKKGETVIAVLRNFDLESALKAAQSDLALEEAEVAYAEAHVVTHTAILGQRLEAREKLAALEGERTTAVAERDVAEASRRGAEAAVAKAKIELDAQLGLERQGGGTPVAREAARAALAQAEAAVAEKRASEAKALGDITRLEALVLLAKEGVENPLALEGEVREHAAELVRAKASRDAAKVALQVAEEAVERLTVRAPMDGVVLKLLSAPGSVSGPVESTRFLPAEAITGSTSQLDEMVGGLVLLYDPAHLQARVDVDVAFVGGIVPGTEVEFTAAAVPGRSFRGTVIRLLRSADVQKNSLQVKVRVLDPDPVLTPEMLIQARFLVKDAAGKAPEARPRLFVPTSALRGDAVLVLDPTGGGRARRVPERRRREADGWTEVEGDLGSSSKVLLDPAGVEDGDRVRGVP